MPLADALLERRNHRAQLGQSVVFAGDQSRLKINILTVDRLPPFLMEAIGFRRESPKAPLERFVGFVQVSVHGTPPRPALRPRWAWGLGRHGTLLC